MWVTRPSAGVCSSNSARHEPSFVLQSGKLCPSQRAPVAKYFPSGEKHVSAALDPTLSKNAVCSPDFASQTLTELSSEADSVRRE